MTQTTSPVGPGGELAQSPRPTLLGATMGMRGPGAGLGRGLAKVITTNRLISVVSVIVAIAVWQGVESFGWVNPLYTSSPKDVCVAFGDLWRSGALTHDTWVSLEELLIGFALSAAVGIPLGLVCGRSARTNAVFSPFVSAGWVMPRIALIPLLSLWFGIGLEEKVAVVFLMCVFPIIVMVTSGAQNVSEDIVKVARAVDGGRLWTFRTLILPASVPSMVAGLRLGFGLGVIAVVVAELYGSTAGLGFLLSNAGANFQMGTMFAAIVVLVVIGMIGMGLLTLLEQRFNKWRS